MEKIKKILAIALILAVLLSGVQFVAQPSASANELLSDSQEAANITAEELASMVLETPLQGEAMTPEATVGLAAGWTNIATENFEGAWPGSGWRVFDNDGATNGEYYWGATTCHDYGASGDTDAVPHAEGASAMYTCWTPYPTNLNSWMIWGPFDLSSCTSAELLFDLDLDSESGHDYFKWMASINGSNFYGYQQSGDTSGWTTKTFDLTSVPTLGNLAGQSQVWIAFTFTSDSNDASHAGPWVDNIILRASSGAALNYITKVDNENNYHTGTPDGDMYPANTDCIYNNNYKPNCPHQSPLAPIEFNIVVPSLPSFSTAELSLYAYDVDEQGGAPHPNVERDEVYLNGHFVGTLTGADKTWSTSHFNVNPSWVKQGNNLVEVKIDVHNACWCVSIDWGQLVLGAGGGDASIRSWGPLLDCWPPGTQQHVMVEVDSSLPSQEVLVEINVLNAQNVNLIGTSQTKTIHGSQDDDFLFLLNVPANAVTGYYTVEVIVYDASTHIQQAYDHKTVQIDPTCVGPSPCTVHLESSQDNHATSNKGTITFHGNSYSLPNSTEVNEGSYSATYYPESGYDFVRWETTGNISVSNSNSQTTNVDVHCGGTLRAIYKLHVKPPPCTVEGNKTAYPSQVTAGDEVTVTITLHGLDDCPVTEEHADIMLVIDRSYSMVGTPLQDAKNAAQAFVNMLDLSSDGDQVGLASYSSSATLDHQLSRIASSVKAAIASLISSGSTNISDGINKAQAELDTGRHDPDNKPVIILMSDGLPYPPEQDTPQAARNAAAAAKAKGTRVITIGLGTKIDEQLMKDMASSASDYYYAPTSGDLQAVYEQIAGALTMGVPARDITLVDRLSDDVTYIPGSASPVPYSVSTDNKVLTWKISVLDRNETRTFTYRVKTSQISQGLVCMNEYTTATYTDSNGDPATLHIPPACVTVKPPAELYYKPGYSDYAPSGIPDFDQRQDNWKDAWQNWSYCGPLAVANCLWWFDSKMEPNPVAPPTINDNYPLLKSYSPGQWDDHNPSNLPPFVEDLAWRMDTDGQRTGGNWGGTYMSDMYNAVMGYLAHRGLIGSYEVTLIEKPSFEWVADEVERCENVILLMGFWTFEYGKWERIGGHFVTTTGVDSVNRKIAFSDPVKDRAESGWPGRVLNGTLISHSPVPGHDSSIHNDAGNVSHDTYDVISTNSPGGRWGPANYAGSFQEVRGFFSQNFPREFPQEFSPRKEAQAYTTAGIQTEVEYALAISPIARPLCTVNLESSQDNNATSNKGTITFSGNSYSLPNTISVSPWSYSVTYNPESGYEFVRWKTSGNISISSSYSQTTRIDVHCGGTLTAIYRMHQVSPPCTVDGKKEAHPDQVKAGDEVMVTITLQGWGDCPMTEELADVMLVIDRSGSMRGTPLQDAKNAAKAFVDRLNLSGGSQVGVVSYSDSATLNHQLSRSRGSVRTAIDSLVSGGNTNITDGINKAQAELESARHGAGNTPVIILMTDGKHNVGAGPGPAATAAKAKGTRIFTIGLGDVDAAELQNLASSTSDYYYAATSSDLEYIYQQIAGAFMGVPATNVTLVDRLSDDVTYIPGSAWPVPYSISPDNKVLTWKIPIIGRWQTKTFRYWVRTSATAQGLVCINEYTRATYTDSNGHTATLDIPPACVTVKSQSHDCYCKDHLGDDGSVPSNPNGESWWESPDIWVRHQQDGIEQHQNPEGGRINYVYAKVRNRGNVTMTDIGVNLYWSNGAVAIVWPGGWTYIGTAIIPTLAPGQVAMVNIPWQPLTSGHYCFLERIHSSQDPVRHEGLVPFDNNLCQKNVKVIETDDLSDNVITVRNPLGDTVQTDVVIASDNCPPGETVVVDLGQELFDNWQDNGGDLEGAEVIPGTTSVGLDVSPTGEVAATIGRIPLDASAETTMELILGNGAGSEMGDKPRAAGSPAKVVVRQRIEGEDVGGNVYEPPASGTTWIFPYGPEPFPSPTSANNRPYLGATVSLPTGTEPPQLELVFWLDETTREWKYFNPNFTVSTLNSLEPGQTYFVAVSGACNWVLPCDEGTASPTGNTWNFNYGPGAFLAPTSSNGRPYLGATVNLPTGAEPSQLVAVYWLDETAREWKYFNPIFTVNTLTQLEPGQTYFVAVSDACSWQLS